MRHHTFICHFYGNFSQWKITFQSGLKYLCCLHGKTKLKNPFQIKLQRLSTATLLIIESGIEQNPRYFTEQFFRTPQRLNYSIINILLELLQGCGSFKNKMR